MEGDFNAIDKINQPWDKRVCLFWISELHLEVAVCIESLPTLILPRTGPVCIPIYVSPIEALADSAGQ